MYTNTYFNIIRIVLKYIKFSYKYLLRFQFLLQSLNGHFYSFRRLKNYMHFTITESRLNCLAILIASKN